MLGHLLDELLKKLEGGNWFIAGAIIAIACFFHLNSIFEFFERRGSRREEFVKEALKIEAVSDTTRTFLEEELNYLVFKRVTGIPADKALREKIKMLVDASQGELRTFQFARARKYLSMEGGRLRVIITRSHKIENFLNWVFTGLIALCALLMFRIAATVKDASFLQIGVFVGLGFTMFAFAMFLVLQTVPLSIAKVIAPKIDALENTTANG